MLCLSSNSIVFLCPILSSTFDISGRKEIGRQFLGSVQEPFLKSDFNFAISKTSRNLLKEIKRLHSCVIGVVNNDAPSLRKIPKRSSMPGTLPLSKVFNILNNFSDSVFANIKLSFKLHFLQQLFTDCIPKLRGGFGIFNLRFSANQE